MRGEWRGTWIDPTLLAGETQTGREGLGAGLGEGEGGWHMGSGGGGKTQTHGLFLLGEWGRGAGGEARGGSCEGMGAGWAIRAEIQRGNASFTSFLPL